MKLPYAEPDPAGSERAREAKAVRDLATEVSRLTPQALTRTNGEEADHGSRRKPDSPAPTYPANFTKGLLHDEQGLLAYAEDYRCFVEAINAPDPTLFEKQVETTLTRFEEDQQWVHMHFDEKGQPKEKSDGEEQQERLFFCVPKETEEGESAEFEWRGWESPRCGHVYELEGPDAGAVGMAPAPRVGSSELAAEMAEVYALALLRDVPFETIAKGGATQLCGDKPGGEAVLSAEEIVDLLNSMPFFRGKPKDPQEEKPLVSSTPLNTDASGLNRFERNRRLARNASPDDELFTELKPATAFRGSTPGAMAGPYISQFLLMGSTSLDGAVKGGKPGFPSTASKFEPHDGFIRYGSHIIDQRTLSHDNCLDYMTDWPAWLDVQNGADTGGIATFEGKRRFITTPRDLATYVHYDALYQAYLNACLILLSRDTPASKGFPEPSPTGKRTPFATFGGPHILSLVTEVATRCLKAVRRQKFNYHRRCRPEAIGGRLSLFGVGGKACLEEALGCAYQAFEATHDEIPEDLREAVIKHNRLQADEKKAEARGLECPGDGPLPFGAELSDFADSNLLLPMAFPEGSPMHPAYGAGHATVAGGCVTMLKAFFEMFDDCDSGVERKLFSSDKKKSACAYIPNDTGDELTEISLEEPLTIQGELDKLAANISIGRNMAGVHYYSDYYDSARMGERIAVGILLQQAPTYGDYVETTFNSFDGDLLTISGEAGSCPSLSIFDRDGAPVSPADWWLRHVSGQEFSEDI